MHKVHHHYVLPYTDSNYGTVFSVWDRLFGTFEPEGAPPGLQIMRGFSSATKCATGGSGRLSFAVALTLANGSHASAGSGSSAKDAATR